MSARVYAGAATPTTLSGSITNVSTSGTITVATNWLTSGQFSIVVDPGLAGEEKILCTLSGTTLTFITRGYDGTTAASHNSGAVVYPVPTAIDFSEANTHVNASSAVHGLAGSVVGTTDTQVLTNKDLSSSTNTFPASTPAGKNAIINGGMDIWQRGTSFAIASGTPQYTADRWTCYFNGTGNITQETSVIPSNSKYAIRLTATATSTDNRIYQLIETNNVLPYAGKAITISVQMAGTVTVPAYVTLHYSTSVDDTLTNTSTNITLTTVTAPTLSNSLQTYVFTGTVPSTAKTLRVGIGTGSVVNTNYFVVANVQLELGSTATTFSRAGGSIGGELALCQRYYYQIGGTTYTTQDFGNGSYYSTTAAYILTTFPVTMRTAPTCACVNPTSFSIYSAGASKAVTTFAASTYSPFNATNAFNVGTAATLGNGCWVEATNANATLTFSSEL